MFKLDLEKAEEPEIKLPKSTGSSKKQERSKKNIYFCFIDYKYINKVRKRNGYSLKEKMPLNGEKIQP